MKKTSGTFYIETLGCAKNAVDSDSMAQLLISSGYQETADPGSAGVLIVNTCGFIQPARDEAVQVLTELAQEKRDDQLLIASGCMTQIYGGEVASRVLGLDGIIGTRNWMDVVEFVRRLRRSKHPEPLFHLPDQRSTIQEIEDVHRTTIQGSTAYIKIADGCRRPCAFCSIPLIKGKNTSRPIDSIINEALWLQDNDVREIILIAQDTTDYGSDLNMKDGLSELLSNLVKEVTEVDWIRILYAYPGAVTERLIKIMAQNDRIVPYLDMPLQHAHPDVLRRMRRPANMDWVFATLHRIRETIPHVALRSTFIVGYPNETENEFNTLLDFVEEIRFDKLGAFKFSFEPDTESAKLGDNVPEEVKQDRYNRLMEIQQRISLEKNQALVGKTMKVLIEGEGEGISVGRTYRDAPEIDGMVLVEEDLAPGTMYPVRITGALAYDLVGVIDKS